jgi:tetratricopeptide (TPR) repeat protein
MALLGSHPDEAIVRFEEAWATLPSPDRDLAQDHCYATALAYWEAGRHEEAAVWFHRLLEGQYGERLNNPMGWVLAHYYLGQFHLDQGDPEKARSYWSKFVDLWNDGEFAPERLAEARRFLRD